MKMINHSFQITLLNCTFYSERRKTPSLQLKIELNFLLKRNFHCNILGFFFVNPALIIHIMKWQTRIFVFPIIFTFSIFEASVLLSLEPHLVMSKYAIKRTKGQEREKCFSFFECLFQYCNCYKCSSSKLSDLCLMHRGDFLSSNHNNHRIYFEFIYFQ